MSSIPSMMDELEKTKKEITELRGQLSLLYAKEKQLTKNIQEQCSHPEEYIEEIWINSHDIDPLEAKIYQNVCRACGKGLRKFSMMNGKRGTVEDKPLFNKDY